MLSTSLQRNLAKTTYMILFPEDELNNDVALLQRTRDSYDSGKTKYLALEMVTVRCLLDIPIQVLNAPLIDRTSTTLWQDSP